MKIRNKNVSSAYLREKLVSGFYRNGKFDAVAGIPPVAEALPAFTSALGNTVGGLRETVTNVGLPAGDWSLGGWYRLEENASNNEGYVFSLYPAAGSTKLDLRYSRSTGELRLSGTDDAAVTLGANSGSAISGFTQIGLLSTVTIQAGQDVYICCQKVGNFAEIWLKFNGHAPVLAAREYTTFGVVAATQTFGFCRGRSDGSPTDGKMRAWHKLSYSLTRAQINDVANGTVLPTSLGIIAGDDFYFALGQASTTWTDTSGNGKNTVWGGGATSTVANLGYADLANAVWMDTVGMDGKVIPHTNGFADIPMAGLYTGSGSGDIQAQLLDYNNNPIVGWKTVATSISGNTWSGIFTNAPKLLGWYKVQLRRTTNPTAVMTTTIRFSVGVTVELGGQSLVDYMRNAGLPYGSSGTEIPNGFFSIQLRKPMQNGTADTEVLSITGTANVGGLVELDFGSIRHGRKVGDKVWVAGIVGTTEANNAVQTVAQVTSATKLTLAGVNYVNAYVSGGSMYIGNHYYRIPNTTYETVSDAHCLIANHIANQNGCAVSLSNCAVGGTSISNHYSPTGNTAPYTLLSGHNFGKVNVFAWAQGHNDIGLSPINQYFASGGVEGAWTGWGLLGTLYDFYKTYWPNTDFKFGVVPFNSVTGIAGYSASIFQSFRHGMKDWCTRKIANGETNVFEMGWVHDLQPQLENNGIGAHLCPEYKGVKSMAARMGHDIAVKLSGTGLNSFGPRLTTATRSGAVVTLPVTHNGGSSLKVLATGAKPTGFQVATDTAFTSLLTISNVTFTTNQVEITLSADPGAPVYVRYMYGFVSDRTSSGALTALVTGVASNGSGGIRVSTVTTPTTATIPTGSQRVGGHGLPIGNNGDWVRISGVKGAVQSNGYWPVNVIDAVTFDLIGSTDVGLGTFATGTLWGGSGGGGTAVVETLLAIPIYDNRPICTTDTNGAPLQPTYSYIVAA